MTRDVLVSITGARFSEHDKEDVEMIIGGDYFWKNGNYLKANLLKSRDAKPEGGTGRFWQVSFLYAKMGEKTGRDRFSVYR